MSGRPFCVDDFWDYNRTWDTDTPRLTSCLRDVGFTIVPSVLVLVFILLEFNTIFGSTAKPIRHNKYNVCRLLICLFANGSNLVLIYNYVHTVLLSDQAAQNISTLTAAGFKLVVFILLIVVHHYQRVKGVITSGSIFMANLILVVSSLVLLLDSNLYNGSMYSDFESNNVYRIFLCTASLFVLSCFADDAVDAGMRPAPKIEDDETLLNNADDSHSSNNSNSTESSKEETNVSPEVYSSFLSRITFFWFLEFIQTASRKKTIHFNDIWQLKDEMKMEYVSERVNREFVKEIAEVERRKRESSKSVKFNSWNTLKVACRAYGGEILLANFLKLINDFITFLSPVLLSFMIKFISDPNERKWHGILLIIGFVSTSLLNNLSLSFYTVRVFRTAINVKSAMMNLIYAKAMRLSNKAKNKMSSGQIVNLMSVDADHFSDFAPFFAFIWSSPVQIAIGFYLLHRQLGNGVFLGGLVIASTMVLQYFLSKLRNRWFASLMKVKDVRIKYTNEMLSGMKIVKLYGWESAFLERITDQRTKEVKFLRNTYINECVNWFVFSLSPSIVLVTVVAVYIFVTGGEFNAEKAFVSILIFNMLDFPVEVLPTIVAYLSMCAVSLKRISTFLGQDELDPYVGRELDEKMAITIRNKAKFVWETKSEDDDEEEEQSTDDQSDDSTNKSDLAKKDKKPFELKDIELEVEKGKFIAVIGQVATGKSSLISAILGEMVLVENELGEKGQVNISRELDISYVAQQAWIQNDTFRGNILFGKPFNSEKYDQIVNACCLRPDLKQFEGGDLTEIGEKGINLSGGQKQRVSLARACYSAITSGNSKQIILLDDVLSAVDAHVGKSLCDDVLNSRTGILRGTTRILVTNQLNQLSDLDVDQIVLLKDGRIELKCTYEELQEMERNGQLDEYNLRLAQNQKTDETDEEDKKSDKSEASSSKTSEEKEKEEEKSSSDNRKLIEKEKLEVGRVNIKNYVAYLKNFGYYNAVIILLFVVLENFFQLYSRIYLSEWTKTQPNTEDADEIKAFHRDHMLYFLLYSMLQCLFNLVANSIILIGILSTVRLFHRQLLYRILRSPMRFFDRTPVGRILNRFSKDIDAIDQALPRATREFVLNCFKLLSSFVLLIIKTDANSILYFCIILVLYYLLMDAFIGSSRQLKRYHNTTKSPIFSHLSETLNGLPTIRAYGKADEFQQETRCKIDINNRAFWYYLQGNRWLNFNLSFLASLVLLVVCVQTVLQKETTNGGDTGLLITYAVSITTYFSMTIRLVSMFETNAVSIERIVEYCENEEEDKWVKDVRPDADWPKNGEIEFIDYSTRYREGTNLVLKDLNFKVNGTEKVGVVGRTGAGKSSMTLALFRIIEPASGRIVIDGVDISQIGLHDLKSRLSIIPQDAILFTGTIRFNLDPFEKHPDDEIYRALEHAHLMDYVNSLEDGIEHKIAEGGENLSVGQRQLICLARALLRKSKILVLDEATASVDFATDELVQNTIRSEFKNCTTITIAHRINTVLDSSRILVLDQGELKEYDSPDSLLKDSRSMFYSLAAKANVI